MDYLKRKTVNVIDRMKANLLLNVDYDPKSKTIPVAKAATKNINLKVDNNAKKISKQTNEINK